MPEAGPAWGRSNQLTCGDMAPAWRRLPQGLTFFALRGRWRRRRLLTARALVYAGGVPLSHPASPDAKRLYRMQLRPGMQVFGRYVLESYLGPSASGERFLGHHQRLGHPVMLRILPARVNEETAGRFKRMAQLMARIRNKHVAAILDYGLINEQTPCIVTELTAGETLQERLNRRRALPWPEATHVLLGTLAGLDGIHAAAVVHRNLNPSNIVIVPGNPEYIKVFDLSLAKSVFDDGSRITKTGIRVGTPAYMAPEQILKQDVDERTDLYAAGLVAYQMLTGGLPGDAEGMKALVARTKGPPERPAAPATFPLLPDAVVDVLMRALQPQASERWDSAQEFARALIQAAQSSVVQRPSPQQSAQTHVAAPYRPGSTASTVASADRVDTRARRPAGAENPWAVNERRNLRLRPRTRPPQPPEPPPTTAPTPVERAPLAMGASGPAETMDEATDPTRIRAVVTARVPADKLDTPSERRWLDEAAGESRSFTLGTQFWIGALVAESDPVAKARCEILCGKLRRRFGSAARGVWSLVDEQFILSEACVDGTAPPPLEVLELLEQVTEDG